MRFANRMTAGRALGTALEHLAPEHPVVVGLARGGVVVAQGVAQALHAPLDVLVVRKIGAPGQPELAVGAIAPGAVWFNDHLIEALDIPPTLLQQMVDREERELRRREARYREELPAIPVQGQTVILVDDGLATGATAHAAVESVRHGGARRVVFAAPVCAPESAQELQQLADTVVCLAAPAMFRAVGEHYADFGQVSDEEVLAAVRRHAVEPVPSSPGGNP